MSDHPTDHAVFTCRRCNNSVLGDRTHLGGLDCCGTALREVRHADVTTTTPTPETVAREVFGLPRNGFDVRQCAIEEGAATVATVADRLGYERSVITRYLNALAETGLLEKTARVRRRGGEVNVYYPPAAESADRETSLALYLWAASAAGSLEDVGGADREASDGRRSRKLATVFWE